MSGLDSLPLDAEGYLDLDQLPADVLDDDAVAQLHEVLLSDPVDEPSDDDWAVLVDDVLDGDVDPPPFAVDDDLAAVAYDSDADDRPADEPDTDVAVDAEDVDADLDADVDLGVIGLDLVEDDGLVGAYDDDLPGDVDADAPAEIGHDVEDYL